MNRFQETLERAAQQAYEEQTENRETLCMCPLPDRVWGKSGWHYFQVGNNHPTAFERCLPYWKNVKRKLPDGREVTYGMNEKNTKKLTVFIEGKRQKSADDDIASV